MRVLSERRALRLGRGDRHVRLLDVTHPVAFTELLGAGMSLKGCARMATD